MHASLCVIPPGLQLRIEGTTLACRGHWWFCWLQASSFWKVLISRDVGRQQPVGPTEGKKKKKTKYEVGFVLLMESETSFLFSFPALIWKKAERVLKLHEGSSFCWFTGAWMELGKNCTSLVNTVLKDCRLRTLWEPSAHAYGLPWVAVGLRTRWSVFLKEDLSLPRYSWAYRFFHSLAGSRGL